MTTIETLKAIASASSKTEKVNLAIANRTPILDEVFDYAYNPDKMFGITRNQFEGTFKLLTDKGLEHNWSAVKKALDAFAAKQVTGNAAVEAVHELCYNMNEDCQDVLFNILDKNLKVGMSFETYQKEVMGIKPTKFEVTLAQHLEDVKGVNPIDGTWFASRKCDGVRCVAFYNGDTKEVKFISRQGKEFTTLNNLKPAVAQFLKSFEGEWVLDGELCKIDANGDEHFDQIVGECKKKDYTIQDCCYQLFDIVPKSVFTHDFASTNFDNRYNLLKDIESTYKFDIGDVDYSKGCYCKVLYQEPLFSQEDFDRWEKKVAEGNWEGFMLRKNTDFEKGRTKNLLKVKKFHDAEYKVLGVISGKITSAEPGLGNVEYEGVKALIIEHKGNKVQVGSGLTKEQRKDWCVNMDHIIGKTICVKYFQESKDKEGNFSLRFPTLKYVYENGRNV